MLFTIRDQVIETPPCFIFAPQLTQCQSLIKDLIRLLIVVIHSSCRLAVPDTCLKEQSFRFLIFTQTLQSTCLIIIEIVLLCTVQLSFTHIMRISETFFDQIQGFRIFPFRQQPLYQLYTGKLILCRNLSFPPFPGMELAGIDHTDRFFISSQLVEQGYIFQIQIVTQESDLFMFVEECKPVGMRTVKTLVQLIELHQDTCICRIESKSLLQQDNRLFLFTQFIEISQ